ncbi:MAG: Zn-ribbon domain-containing OB-fold protein, partial [Alphaproteobacteria bacterium]
MTAYAKPLPKLDALNRPFWELARDHKLAVKTCDACGHRHFPPGPVCPACLGKEQSWEVVSGRGTLLSWVTFHRAYWGGFAGDLPYDVCLVELDEGPVLV